MDNNIELYTFVDKNTAHSIVNNNDISKLIINGNIRGYSNLDVARNSIPQDKRIDNYIIGLKLNNPESGDFISNGSNITINNIEKVIPVKLYRAESDQDYWDRKFKSNREARNKFANQRFGIDEGLVKLNLKLYESYLRTQKKSNKKLLFERMSTIAGFSVDEDWVNDPETGLKVWSEPDRERVDKGVVDYGEETPEGQSGFCKYNPEISKWSLTSANNLAMTLSFVIVSQQESWGRLMAYYPDVIEYIYREGNAESFPEFRKGATFSPVINNNKRQALDMIWSNKDNIYSNVVSILKPFGYQDKSKKSEDAAFELYKFFASAIRGLGNVKAGFATQLVIGRSGCIDSINQRLFGDQDPKIFKSYKKVTGKPLEHMTNYYSYIESLGDDSSKMLWDKWTEIVSNKLLFGYSNKIKQKSKPVVVKKDDKEYDAGKYLTQPDKYLDSNMAKNRSPLDISQQHHPEFTMDTMGISPDAIKRNKKL